MLKLRLPIALSAALIGALSGCGQPLILPVDANSAPGLGATYADGRGNLPNKAQNHPPILNVFTANPTNQTVPGGAITFFVDVTDEDGDTPQFIWAATGGTLSTNVGRTVVWTPPDAPGTYSVLVTLSDGRGGIATGSQNIIVTENKTSKVEGQPAITTPQPTSAPQSPQPESNGSTTSGEPASTPVDFSNVNFGVVKEFKEGAVPFVVDFNTVIVAEGTTLHVTTDRGATWAKYTNVGTQPIKALYFRNGTTGWVGYSSGALLKVSLSDGTAHTVVQDTGDSIRIFSIYFADENIGYMADGGSGFRRTTDGGNTWSDRVTVGPDSTLFGNGRGGVLAQSNVVFPNSQGLYQDKLGAFTPVKVTDDDGKQQLIAKTSIGGTRNFVQLENARWAYTDDLKNFVMLPENLQSASQISSDQLKDIWPVNENALVASTDRTGIVGSQLVFSTDAGKTWSDPLWVDFEFSWIKPFDGTRMWAWSNDKLYRSGE